MNRTSNKDYWMPGETLLHRDDSHFHPISMAHGSQQGSEGLQSGIDSKLSTIMNTLDSVYDRLDTMETRQKCLEEVRASSSSGNCSPATPLPGRRMHRTPTALQVCVPSYLPLIYFQLILYY